jgi:hypothetical protein
MAFPAASASVQQIKTPTYGDIMQERDAFMVQQNALAQQQLKQQQNAMLNRAYAEAYDPQTGGVNTNKLFGSLASGGMGSEIPGQMEAVGKGQEATAKGSAAKLKYAQELLTVSRNELGSANTPEEAIMAGQRIAQQYPEAKDSVLQSLAAVQGMTPEQFGAWKMDALRKNLSAEQQLKQNFVTQNLGESTRVLSMPEYGAGKAQVVQGSEAKVTMSPAQMNPAGRVVQDANGNYVVVDTRAGTAKPVTMGGGGGGGGAPALATNPGALKDGAFAKAQPGYAGARGGFAVFDTPEAGVAAQERLLSSAYVGRGFNTIDKIVNRYAPPGPENSGASVSNYKSYIAQRTGLDINAPISPAQVPAVAAAMREFETGQRPGGAPGQPVRAPAKSPTATAVKEARAPAEAFNAMTATQAKYDDTIARAERLLNNPSLDTIVGNVQGNIPETALSLYSQSAANALSDYNELLAVAGFQELQAMRDASPTGGALGQVSDSENKLLQQSAFASSRTQDEKKFKESLRTYIKRLRESRSRVNDAYQRTFGQKFAPPQRAAPTANRQTPTSGLPDDIRKKYGL